MMLIIYLVIYVKVDLAKANNPKEEIKGNPGLNWVGSSSDQKEEYVQHLENLLQDLSETPAALLCENVLCDHPVHVSDIDQATKKLLGAVSQAAWESLEITKGTTGDQCSRAFTIQGWNDMVKPCQGEAQSLDICW